MGERRDCKEASCLKEVLKVRWEWGPLRVQPGVGIASPKGITQRVSWLRGLDGSHRLGSPDLSSGAQGRSADSTVVILDVGSLAPHGCWLVVVSNVARSRLPAVVLAVLVELVS
eukprot:COSAG02_NODE_338_length_24206_cov_94.612685_5_plen_114_part_00